VVLVFVPARAAATEDLVLVAAVAADSVPSMTRTDA